MEGTSEEVQMGHLTLESLAQRVDALEEKVADLTRPKVRPGNADWDTVDKAVRELEDYDSAAQRVQQDYDLKHAEDHLK
jgi:hypothetical protein